MSHTSPITTVYGRFFQIGYVARDIGAAVDHLAARMGAQQIDLLRDVRDAGGAPTPLQNLAHMRLPGAELEIIQPRLEIASIYLDSLPPHDDFVRLHHLGFEVADEAAWDNVMATLDTQQTPIALMFDTPHVRCAYLDTRAQAGHYSEVVLRKVGGA